MTTLDSTAVTLAIPGTWNARDAATLTDLTSGVVLRSAALMGLTDAGRAELQALGVTDVVDLRSDPEIAQQGSDAIAGAGATRPIAEHLLPISPGSVLGPANEDAMTPQAMGPFFAKLKDPGFAEKLLTSVYVEMVTTPAWVDQLGRGLGVIARAQGGTVVHCSAGKDRTGVLVALAAEIAGAEREAINADYLYSNHAVSQQTAALPAGIPAADLPLIEPLLAVHLASLDAARSAITATYGGLGGFLTAAGVDGEVTGLIRERFGSSA